MNLLHEPRVLTAMRRRRLTLWKWNERFGSVLGNGHRVPGMGTKW